MKESTVVIKVGSVVRLKSGGPNMTISHISVSTGHCLWFPATLTSLCGPPSFGSLGEGDFPWDSLEMAPVEVEDANTLEDAVNRVTALGPQPRVELFRIGTRDNPGRWVIYTNGDTDGFPSDVGVIVNTHPSLVRAEVQKALDSYARP
jgi:hypothetical protein